MIEQLGRSLAAILFVTTMTSGTAMAGSTHVGHKLAQFEANAAHLKFYDTMIARYNENPVAFTHRHHLMAHAIRDAVFNRESIDRLLAQPSQMILNHYCFSRFLDGELQALAALGSTNGGGNNTPGIAGEGLTGMGGNTGDSTSPSAAIVPEPSSFILFGTASLVVAIARYRKLRHHRIPSHCTVD